MTNNLFRLLLTFGMLCLVSTSLLAQKKVIEVLGTVTDESGQAIENARIFSESNNAKSSTKGDGTFVINTDMNDVLLIESDGNESMIVNVSSLLGGSSILQMVGMPFGQTEQDVVQLPFGTLSKRQLVGPAYTFKSDEILEYDQRQGVEGFLSTRVPGLFGNIDNRGISQCLIVVDGIPRDADNINLQEVEEITYLADASNRLLYGTQANNGIILITTKRGHRFKERINVSVEQGFDIPISYPNFLNSYDYARMYNQASLNDGLSPRYDSATLVGYRDRTNSLLYPDQNYYDETFLRNFRPFSNVITEFSGGNKNASYYLNLGWRTTGSLITVGEGADIRSDRLNIRANVDFKVTEQIKMNVDVVAIFDRSHEPSPADGRDFWSDAARIRPNDYPMLIDTSDITLPNPGIITNYVEDGKILGGTSQFQQNIYGDLVSAGYSNPMHRTAQFNTGLDFDLKNILYGLSAKAYLSFDIYNYFRSAQENDYAVYEVIPNIGDTLRVKRINEDVFSGSQVIRNQTFKRKIGYFGTLNYNRTFGDDHILSAVALAYADRFMEEDEFYPELHLNFAMRANYMYKDKYILQLSSAVPGSPKLAPGNRFALSYSAGAAWVLSEEGFLSRSSVFNYLKLKASYSLVNTDEGLDDYFMYSNSYIEASDLYMYANQSYGNYPMLFDNFGNPLIGYEKRSESNVGMDASLMDYKLHFTANYFYSKSFDEVQNLDNLFPAYLGGFSINENYASYQDQGADFGIYYNGRAGEMKFNLGLNAIYSVPKVLIRDEPNYEEDYRKRVGKASDAIFGYVADGFFADADDIADSPAHTFGDVQPGDIKYLDLNDDNMIDEKDQKVIGNNGSRFQLGINLNLKYKNLEFFTQAICQSGGEELYNSEYYWIYGDRKYSELALNSWTQETAETADYPRLSTQNNSNNFRNSTFWLEDNDYFTLRAVQVSYNLPAAIMNGLPVSQLKFYLRAQNVFTLSPSKKQLELNEDSLPQFRSYSTGITLLF
ncbi:MAG: carboxypeptidase-like regulatory domain-containing protein [Bacteroidales bacterium]|nr:carboxypeptidase-like regulatory domain-containing protein [Bacteroidales bacterium]MCF8389185.1 carboxypeptidase-like regulatory domain-containing protein [Bacteroidales bacterium]